MFAVDHYRAIDDLENAIANLARQIDATTYRYLELVREFDERRGWVAYSFTDCAQWLSHRCVLSLQTAHDHVRVARALKDLPAISSGLADGSLSYSKVRALVRYATVDNEHELVAFARRVTASTLEDRIRELRNGETGSVSDANRHHQGRRLHRSYGEGTMKIEVELPIELGELVMKAIEQADAGLVEDPEASADFFARQADALVDVAKSYLSGGRDGKSTSTADLYQVLIHVDAAALEGDGGRADLPVSSVQRLLCDGAATAVVEKNGDPLSIGRKQRTVPPAIRRALAARDRHCTFPGCTHSRYLDAHHIQHWVDGGETSLDNLVLLCSRHHRLLHEGRYRIRRDHAGNCYFLTARGRALPACGRCERSDTDPEQVSAERPGVVSAESDDADGVSHSPRDSRLVTSQSSV